MTIRNIIFSILASAFFAANATVIPGFPLSQGATAYKIELDGDGIYEISYEKLSELGFSNPEKVGIAGYGGAMMPMNFKNISGDELLSETPAPVSVMHADGRLYFYASGTSSFSLTNDGSTAMGARYTRDYVNIYSSKSVYILTDDEWALKEMETMSQESVDSAEILSSGIGFFCHDLDLIQNSTLSGNLFWGEKFHSGNPTRHSWKADTHGAVDNPDATLECVFYVDNDISGSLGFGVEDDSAAGNLTLSKSTSTYIIPKKGVAYGISLKSDNESVFVEFNSESKSVDYANLDYWILSYPKSTASLFDFSENRQQNNIGFSLSRGMTYKFQADTSAKTGVFDITDSANPILLKTVAENDGHNYVYLSSGESHARLIAADLSKPQQSPSAFTRLSATGLKEKMAEGAELLVITTDALREKAEVLASLHERHDGIRAVVATLDELYTEFSSCMPSPMAYRCAARTLYDNKSRRLKNVLVFCPLTADPRGIMAGGKAHEMAIALQEDDISAEKGAMNTNDFIGMMSDYVNLNILNSADIQVGVGLLPVNDQAEADIVTGKIERYLNDRDDYAYAMNEILSIGGVGDTHTHDKQAIKVSEQISSLSWGSTICSNLAIDAYGNESARNKMLDYFQSGKNLALYIGHGATIMLGKDNKFFSSGDVDKLRNNALPFMIFAGCDITNFDRGQRGIGEQMVISTPHGLIGSLLSNRSSWSGQNMEMITSFFNNLYNASGPVTIGEVYAATMTQSSYKNELAYHLLCDPALRLPIATGRIEPEAGISEITPLENVTLKGIVTDRNGERDLNFSGSVIVKITEPAKTEISADYVTGDGENPEKRLTVTYADNVIAVGSGTVENGAFKAEIYIPESISAYSGGKAGVYFWALDDKKEMFASGMRSVAIGSADNPDATRDIVPPVVESMEYDGLTNTVKVTVSDDTAVAIGNSSSRPAFEASLDGMLMLNSSLSVPRPDYTEGSRKVSRTVTLPRLGEGQHDMTVKVADASGNITAGSLSFVIGETSVDFYLSMSERVVDDSVEFRIEGGDMRNPELRIIDSDGNTVFSSPMEGTTLQWTGIGDNGSRLPGGLYRAFVKETGDATDKSQSSLIDVPVI